MARYSAGMVAAGAGTSVRPIFAILTTGSPIVTAQIREIMLINTTATDCQYEVVKFHGGTAGATVTNVPHRFNSPASICLAKQLWTADATIDLHTGDVIQLGAAKGSAAYLTWGLDGLETADTGTTYGIGLVPIGTGQVCAVKITWDE